MSCPSAGSSDSPSRFFFTFHKCASTLFSTFVLPRVSGFAHLDYQQIVDQGLANPGENLPFEPRGKVFGPIRIGVDGAQYDQVVVPATRFCLEWQSPTVVMVRDPRDLLLSMYYSFGFSHYLSPIPEVRQQQLADQEKIRQLGLDGYALKAIAWVAREFERAREIRQANRNAILLRYEDMIQNWPQFAESLSSVLPLEASILEETHRRSRPREVEEIQAHQRSGQVGQWRERFQPQTIEELKRKFAAVLLEHEYPLN